MSEWKELKLGNVVMFQRGHDLPKTEMKLGKYPVAGSNGIIGYHNAFTTKAPGITIGRSGNIGTPHFYEVDFWSHNTVLFIKDFKGNSEKFIYYFLKTLDFTQFNTGSAVPSLNRNHIHELDVNIPPLPEQRAIASVLSSLDDKIDLLQRQNDTLETMAETLFRQWFVEEAVLQSENQIELDDLIESVSITHRFPNSQVVFLNTSDIYRGEVLVHDYSVVKTLPGQAKKSIQKDDILFSEIRPANGRYAYIDFEANDYVVSTKLMVLRSKKKMSQAFIYFYLTNKLTVEWLQVLAESRSGTFPQITFDEIKTLKINIPSKSILEETISWCETSLLKIKFNNNQIRTLTQTRDILLPKLMSGEVRVFNIFEKK
jgi:type I restriction enzyme S subunit